MSTEGDSCNMSSEKGLNTKYYQSNFLRSLLPIQVAVV